MRSSSTALAAVAVLLVCVGSLGDELPIAIDAAENGDTDLLLCMATGIAVSKSMGELTSIDAHGVTTVVSKNQAAAYASDSAFDPTTATIHYLVETELFWHYSVDSRHWTKTFLNLPNCTSTSGQCVHEIHWDQGASVPTPPPAAAIDSGTTTTTTKGAIIGVALGWGNASSNWVVWLDPGTGMGRGIIELPEQCGIVAGASAFHAKSRTYYVTLECDVSKTGQPQIYAFDVAALKMVTPAVYAPSSDAAPLAPLVVAQGPTQAAIHGTSSSDTSASSSSTKVGVGAGVVGVPMLYGFANSSLVAVMGPNSTRTVVAAIPGMPADHTAVWRDGRLFVQVFKNAHMLLLELDLTSGKIVHATALQNIFDMCHYVVPHASKLGLAAAVPAAASTDVSPLPPNTTHVTLNSGHAMPIVSLGTCCHSQGAMAVQQWLGIGGVGIDTAIGYGSEVPIAAQLAAIHPPPDRSKLFLTTKIHAGAGKESDCTADPSLALKSVEASLKNLNVEYLDLVLLHRPCEQVEQACLWNRAELRGCDQPFGCNCFGPARMNASAAQAGNAALWVGLQQAVAKGLVRSIGVSNYGAKELAALPGTVPAVNQCEMSIEGADNATLAYCKEKGIYYQSYGAVRGCPFDAPAVLAAAKAHGVSPAQVCLRWTIEKGAIAAAGVGTNASETAQYARENLGVAGFGLVVEEVAALDRLQL